MSFLRRERARRRKNSLGERGTGGEMKRKKQNNDPKKKIVYKNRLVVQWEKQFKKKKNKNENQTIKSKGGEK